MSYQVIAIRQYDSENTNPVITHIAYDENFFNPKIIIDSEQAMARIAKNKKEFYVIFLNRRFYLSVVKTRNSNPYLHAGAVKGTNYLYELQRC